MADYTRADLERIGRTWLEKIRQSEKREDAWMKEAEKAETAYLVDEEAENGEVPRFNILHSNVETIVPSIYNSTPRPDIRPRHNNKDDIAKEVSDLLERAIQSQIDDNKLDKEIESGAQDAFMAGRDIVRVKFDADVEDAPVLDPMGQPAIDPETGEPLTEQRVTNERVLFENVSWRDYREGPAKRWADVPWVAYRHEVSDEERERLENPDIVRAQKTEDNVDEDKDSTVWEIWCRETGSVYFVVDESAKVLSIEEDPLGLSGFFPQGSPVQPITGTGKRCPVCPYSVYKKLAEELDLASKRINAIMKGLRVRGAIAADAEAVELLAQAGDNEVIPIPNIENLAAAGGLEKAVMWWPIDTAINVLRELYAQREQTKQAIYEVTGISDIIRGQGAASETATAQQIKTEWGSLRIKKMQRLIERQVRDLFVITAELMTKHFSFETLGKAAGMQISPQAAQLLEQPLDHYRIDVESDSTIRADSTKNRQQMAQFLEGTAQFMGNMQPLVAAAPQAAGPIVEMYSAFARQFSLGKSAEDALDQLVEMAQQAAQQAGQQENPEVQARKAELQMEAEGRKAELQLKAQELEQKREEAGAKLMLEREKLKLDAAKMGEEPSDVDLRRAELDARKLDLEAKKLDIEAAELGVQLNERDAKAINTIEAPFNQFREQMQSPLEQLAAGLAAISQQLKDSHESLSQQNQQVLDAMTAPKRLVRDDNGRPVGVEIVRH